MQKTKSASHALRQAKRSFYRLKAGQNLIRAQPRSVISAIIMAESTMPRFARKEGLSP